MKNPRYPSLYQINTRVWITDIANKIGRAATLDDIPDNELDRLAEMGFDWIWFLSVWSTGEAAQKISRDNPEWRHDFENTLPDLREKDIAGSGFAITGYKVHSDLGGDEALKRLRERLQKRGLKLMLDFVPNHMAPDHPWVNDHPDHFVSGTLNDLEKNPQNYTRIKKSENDLVLAYGRDPYFSGWPDTVQLDYSNPETVKAMSNELLRISGQCDGVRCDMAMLILPDVLKKHGAAVHNLSGPLSQRRSARKILVFFLWQKCIGILNGHFNSKVLITLMTSVFMIVYLKVMQRQYVNIFMQGLITRISLPAFLKIMMNQEPLQHLIKKLMKPLQ
jgi:hypothetical protein